MRDPSRMRSQTYRYAEGTHSHPRALFRHSHGRRFRAAARLLDARPGQQVLDYGTGDGFLLQLLLAEPGTAGPLDPRDLTGLEPMDFLREQFEARHGVNGVRLVDAAGDLETGGFQRVACLEVLEHLRPPALEQTLGDLERLLAPDGVLVVSVPIEIGPSVVAKYIAARLLTRMDRWYRGSEVLRAGLGLPVERDTEGEFLSHKGYDHRLTRRQLRDRFRMEAEVYSPIRLFGPVLNSQVLWRLRAPGDPRQVSGRSGSVGEGG